MRYRAWMAALLGFFSLPPAQALDLAEAYRLAQRHDPSYQAVAARAEAAAAGTDMARGQLLPQVGANGGVRKMWVKRETGNRRLPTSANNAWNWSVNLTQPLYHPAEWAGYQQSKDLARSAQLQLTDAAAELLTRVAQTYLQLLNTTAQWRVAKDDVHRAQIVLRQAQTAFANGEGTRTDVEEAKARLDEALASRIHWQGEVEIARQRLVLLIGQPVSEEALQDVADRYHVAHKILAKNPDAWVDEAVATNAGLKALQAEVAAARQKLQQAWAGHKPTLDLVASYRQSSSDSEITLNQTFKTGIVGLQASLPLFSGGTAAAGVHQAKAQLQEAKLRFDARSLEIRQQVLDAFSRIRAGVSELQARRQALKSARQALTATRKGVEAGTRNTVDVLDAEYKVSQAQAKHADAVYNLLQAVVELLAAVNRPPEGAIAFLIGTPPPTAKD